MTVVVTGVGTVGAFGAGRSALAAALAAGEPRLSIVDRSAGYHRPRSARTALLLGDLDLSPWLPGAAARRMSAPSRMAVAAARLAEADANLPTAAPAETAVFLATSFGATAFTERLLTTIFQGTPVAASPALFSESVASAAASQVAIDRRALGPSLTITQREAGPLLALGEGVRWVARASGRRALVGACEEMTPLLHAILDRFHALARPEEDGQERARPFDRDRQGFLAAEGATVLVVEREAEARSRGARIVCRVSSAWSAFDPTASAVGWGEGGAQLGEALRAGLARAGVAPAEVDCILSGASGSRRGDRLEADTLRAAWQDRELPPILAPKAVTGEYSGGFLAAAALLGGGAATLVHRAFARVDPELGIQPREPDGLPPPRRALVTSLAAGGAAAWALLESGED
ncbi:MAG TPA: beta-ketoacyl synthase N-terminal-like domain-containing protein [Thermoanaerobaculia bacterium]|nr:beta-ketoacyl synthase N-terminal-like domain-containing protein [Thermoanaerobaculia bacterium]